MDSLEFWYTSLTTYETSESRLVCVACIDIRVMQISGLCIRFAAYTAICPYQIPHMQQPAVLQQGSYVAWVQCLPITHTTMMLGKYIFVYLLSAAHFNDTKYITLLSTSHATLLLILCATLMCASETVPKNCCCFVCFQSWRMLLPHYNMPIW